jgi:putative oxidoreductase
MRHVDLAWALVRVTTGLSLAGFHGWGKVNGGVDKLVATVARLGFPHPEVFAWCASLAEFAGGLLVAVGLFTRPAAAAAAFTMMVALYNHRADPFAKAELALLYFAVMAAATLLGSGRFGVDAMLGVGGAKVAAPKVKVKKGK